MTGDSSLAELRRSIRSARDARYREIWASLADRLTPTEAVAALMSIDRVDGPAMLFDMWYGRRIDRPGLMAGLPAAWSGAEYPERSLTRRVWIDLFRLAAYPPPAEPVELYRGAPPRYARGMAWTTRYSKAEWFAGRRGMNPGHAVAHVYTVVAPPEAILADIDALEPDGRGEGEMVVDPSLIGALRRV